MLRVCNRTTKELKKKSLSCKSTLKTIMKSCSIMSLHKSINILIRDEMQLNLNLLNTSCGAS